MEEAPKKNATKVKRNRNEASNDTKTGTRPQNLKLVFSAFQKYGAENPEEIKKVLQHLQMTPCLEEFVNEFATISEERVLSKMQNSPEFVQCASWSEIMDSVGFRETCNNELPLALRTIAYTEKFPKPENANGVDFQLLYLNLANMMMGQPIRVMNQNTQKVLKQVYEETVLQTSQSDQKEEIAILHETLKAMRNPVQSNDDPRTMTDLRLFFADPNINPFRLPIDRICSNHPVVGGGTCAVIRLERAVEKEVTDVGCPLLGGPNVVLTDRVVPVEMVPIVLPGDGHLAN
uniref:Uncharacterized protein n=1 Tax=Anopheles culicifacies TaxID=139723 RepID=A0A182MPW9_9DIPT